MAGYISAQSSRVALSILMEGQKARIDPVLVSRSWAIEHGDEKAVPRVMMVLVRSQNPFLLFYWEREEKLSNCENIESEKFGSREQRNVHTYRCSVYSRGVSLKSPFNLDVAGQYLVHPYTLPMVYGRRRF